MFFEAFKVVNDNLVQMNYGFGQIQNDNSQAAIEGIQICLEL